MSFASATAATLPEPLPRYTRDPDTTSILSSAPSYTSQAPSYHSSQPTNGRSVTFAAPSGLPSPRYAPGFRRGTSAGSLSMVENHNYNISEWSSVTNGPQARHYHNVAQRRATVASVEGRSAFTTAMHLSKTLTSNNMEGSGPGPCKADSDSRRESDSGEEDEEEDTPLSPFEDPHLVGDEAAARAKAQRLYMRRYKDEEALRQEKKTWDFMLAQMADWKEREKSWDKFRKEVGRSRLLGRRTGLRDSVG